MENIRENLEKENKQLSESIQSLQQEVHHNLTNIDQLKSEIQHTTGQVTALMEERTNLLQQLTTLENQMKDVSTNIQYMSITCNLFNHRPLKGWKGQKLLETNLNKIFIPFDTTWNSCNKNMTK